MLELFTGMMKEEWRIHSTIFGSLGFALFPILIFAIAFMGSFVILFVREIMPVGEMIIIVHVLFVLLGLMVGSFGLLGREFMNRRFGQASLLAYSSRSLPITEKIIFINFVLKDILYYLILWVLPFCLGIIIASPIAGISLHYPLLLLLTLTLSFLSGLVLVFFLSTAYAHGKTILAAVLGILILMLAIICIKFKTGPVELFPPIILFYDFSYIMLGISIISIIILFAVSVVFLTTEYSGTEKRFENKYTPLSTKFGFLPGSAIVAKDLIDLSRSGAGVGQTIFSFILPLCLIWLVLSILSGYIPVEQLFLVLAVLTGVISSTMYTWLTEFDTPRSYLFLPLDISTVIQGKMAGFALLQIIPVLFIISMAFVSGVSGYLIPALVLCCSVSYIAVSLIVYLCGLSPSILIYNIRVLFLYMVVMGPVILFLIIISFISPWYSLASILFIVPFYFLSKKGIMKWKGEDYQGF